MIKVAINGFGRIGRMVYRAALSSSGFGENFDILAINDLASPDMLAHLLKYDSVHGKLNQQISAEKNWVRVGQRKFQVFSEKDPASLPWSDLGIDVVVESTGRFRTREDAKKHIQAGAKKVIISAPAKSPDVLTIVLGVNDEEYQKNKHDVVSLASCTTNSLAPPLKVLNDKFGIENGFMTTVHAYTSDQNLQDFPHTDWRRARSAALSIIPTTTGAAKATGLVIPELKGKIDGVALRVPTADGSLTDFTALLKRETTKEELNGELKRASQHELEGIMEFSEEPLVSQDIIDNPHSAIIDGLSTNSIGNLAKVFSWYDNEYGYACRVVDSIPKLL
jgi:glyceraldehyde 3-phosphate dehydrogenase